MKKRYIELMARALSAYTDEHINNYFTKVKTEGLTEHGFPRLTANLGILISHGIRTDLLPLFCEMMDFCCEQIPRVKAANDFSVREIVLCLMEVERAEIVDRSKLEGWKAQLDTIVATSCYDRFAILPTDNVHNWACFTALSEFMRLYIGLGADPEFIDTQIASQLLPLDENGMYRDPHEPMVYDLVPRGLFALLLHFGYNGRYRDKVDNCLRTAGLHTLKMQSVTGEIPYGGRSNHCVFNEALIAIVLEYEATRYARECNTALASQFKAGVRLVDAARRRQRMGSISQRQTGGIPMSKHNDRKHSGRKGVMGTFLALLLIGALAIAVPVIMQDVELNRDAAEYEELRKSLATAAPVPTPDSIHDKSSKSIST